MITFGEGAAFLRGISTMSKFGLFPFSVDVENRRLNETKNWNKTAIWYLSLVFKFTYMATQFDHMIGIYLLDSDHAKASPFQVIFVSAIPITVILEIYITVFKSDMLFLIFNEIFGGEPRDNRRRPWKKMPLDDLILRYLFPLIVRYSAPIAAVTLFVSPKLFLRPVDLPRFVNLRHSQALCFVLFFIDVHYYNLIVVQFVFECFILIIIWSKIVESLLKIREAKRYHGIERERVLIGMTKKVELYSLLANQLNGWTLYAVKLACLIFTIAFMFTIIYGNNVVFTVVSIYASTMTTLFYGSICYFGMQVPNEMEELRRQFTAKTLSVAIPEHRSELVASVKSMRVVPVQVGSFHEMDRESFLMFVDFVVNQLVSLLVVQNT